MDRTHSQVVVASLNFCGKDSGCACTARSLQHSVEVLLSQKADRSLKQIKLTESQEIMLRMSRSLFVVTKSSL